MVIDTVGPTNALALHAARTTTGHGAMAINPVEVKVLADRYLKARGSGGFPSDLTPVEAAQMAAVALAYGFDPLLQELTVYQHRPYVTIDGRIRVAQNNPMYDGIEELRPATDAERLAFRCGEDEHLWFARVWRKDRRFPFPAYGRARPERGKHARGESPEASHPQEMAQKRALYRALRLAFPIPIPGVEADEEDGGYYVDTGNLEAGGAVVDVETGEYQPPSIRLDQTKAIHAIARAIGWITGSGDTYDDSEYRKMLADTFDIHSSDALSEADASAIIDLLSAEQERQADGREAAEKTAEFQAEVKASRKSVRDLAALDDDPTPGDWDAYRALVTVGVALGIDMAPFETDGTESRARLSELADKLDAAIRKARAAQPGLPS